MRWGLGSAPLGTRSSLAAAVEAACRREQLLVLDNVEHLLAAAPAVAELLAAGPGLRILVTSREALGLRGEHVLVVPPLAFRTRRRDGETVRRPVGATRRSVASWRRQRSRLFEERARAARADFALDEANGADIAAICAAAGRAAAGHRAGGGAGRPSFPSAIRERIERQRSTRFALLTGGPRDVPPRLRTMRDAIAWSYDLLDNEEQVAFRRLAVFSGGFRYRRGGDGLRARRVR